MARDLVDKPCDDDGEDRPIPREARRRIRLLVVEDDRTLREGLALTLQADGFTVSSAASGEAAVTALERTAFEIVITDLHLTDITGMDVMRTARRAHPGVIVIVITGDPSLPACLAAVRSGAWDCLPKPFSADHLNRLLARAVRHVLARADAGAVESDEHLVAEFERIYLGRLVLDAGGDIDRAARRARIDRATLEKVIEQHGLGRTP